MDVGPVINHDAGKVDFVCPFFINPRGQGFFLSITISLSSNKYTTFLNLSILLGEMPQYRGH